MAHSVVFFPDISKPREINNQFLSTFGAGVISGVDTTSQEISGIDFDSRFFANVFQEQERKCHAPQE
jgi:hypothetical protein